jgi:hypothetical protein
MSVRFITHTTQHQRFLTTYREILDQAHREGISYIPELVSHNADYTICLCNFPTSNPCTEIADLHVSVFGTTGTPSICGLKAIQKAMWLLTVVGKTRGSLNLDSLSEVPWIREILNDRWADGNPHYLLAMNAFHLQPR